MPELRWTLLILGALFIGVLAVWEFRRKRHARGQEMGVSSASGRDNERLAPTLDDGDSSPPRGDPRVFREPTLTLPDVHFDTQGERASADRALIGKPPVVELDDASIAALKVEPHTVVDEFSPAAAPEDPEGDVQPPSDEALDAAEEEAVSGIEEPVAARARDDVSVPEEAFDAIDASRPPPNPAPTLTTVYAADAEAPVVVEWPEEPTRKIIAFRLVSGTGERFQGRAVRQALAAEGFQIGKFEIFHKPGPGARAMLSAASLSKPGTFSLGTMDGQRYGGLSLFAVLPGPLPAVDTFDELLLTARSLNDRLRGALQDERGEPLTPVRSASIRDSLASSPSDTAH